MKKFGSLVLYLVTAPYTFTVSYGWVLLLWACCAAEKLRWEPTGVLTAQWMPWVVKPRGKTGWRLWKWSTTLGRGIIYQPKHRATPGESPTHIQRHEHVHVRQVEDMMLLGLCLGTIVAIVSHDVWLGLLTWWSSGFWQITNFVSAVLRGGEAYLDSEHERSAYAQVTPDIHGKCWLDQRQTGL